MLSADYLFLMTDVDCLYTSNPRIDPSAQPIPVVSDFSALEADVSSAGSALGTGGMGTKIVAAKLGTAAGVTTIITRSSKPGNVAEIVDHLEALKAIGVAAATPDEISSLDITHDASYSTKKHPEGISIPPAPPHTRFLPSLVPIRDRSFWLLHGLTPRGVLYIDEGAYRALRSKAGLLPAGIVGVEGNFAQQEAVRLVVVSRDWKSIDGASAQESPRSHPSSGPSSRPPSRAAAHPSLVPSDSHSSESDPGTTTPIYDQLTAIPPNRSELLPAAATLPHEVGRALVNYAAPEVAHIKGLQSGDIERLLGYADSEYVALRENISLFDGKESDRARGRKARGEKAEVKELSIKLRDL
jgi:glutamate 5-kinase